VLNKAQPKLRPMPMPEGTAVGVVE
jgi:hypothetical protein